MNENISIRNLQTKDCQIIADAFAEQGWDKPLEIYQRYFEEQQKGIRKVLVAFYKGEFAGYLTIVPQSDYPPFAKKGIPEIVDFNVLMKFQKQKIGTKLMDVAEKFISETSDFAGIGVGLFSDYGNAQRLYIKRGYVPDGRGIFQNGKFLKYGDEVLIDDGLALYFTKKLR